MNSTIVYIADVFESQGRILDAFVSKFGTLKHSIPQVILKAFSNIFRSIAHVLFNRYKNMIEMLMICAYLDLLVHCTCFVIRISVSTLPLCWIVVELERCCEPELPSS
jgi:hypothetical protein